MRAYSHTFKCVSLLLLFNAALKSDNEGLDVSKLIILTSNYCEVKYRQLIFQEDRHVLDYNLVLDCRMFSGGLYSPKNRLNKFFFNFLRS